MYNPETHINKRLKKPKGQSRMDNPQKLATLGAQDTRRYWAHNTLQRQTTKHKPQHRKVKIWATLIPPINPRNPRTRQKQAVPVSY